MPYNALGDFDPGAGDSWDESPVSPLDTVKSEIKKISAQANPMLAPLYLRDIGRMGVNMVSPVAATWAGALGNIQAKGSELLHRALGDEASAAEAAKRITPVEPGRYYMQPQSPLMRAAEEDIGKALSFLPAAGPGSGMPGHDHVSPRPMLTPNDVRVMGAEAARVGRQVRDIPIDFQNAQSGLTRLDPITGQPTMGARLQGVAEDVGRIAEQRQSQGLSSVPGVPSALTPETSMYAVRPQGSRLVTAAVPETARGYSPTYDPINDVITDSVDVSKPLAPTQVMTEINTQHLNEANTEPHLRLELKQAFKDFMHQQIADMFPDAPSFKDAKNAYEIMFNDREARAANGMKMYDAFLDTPEGQRLKGALGLPTTGEIEARHDAATAWLNGQFSNYLTRNYGAEGDPLVKLASQGLTYKAPNEIIGDADAMVNNTTIRKRREAAGMPIETPLEVAEQSKFQELQAANQELGTLEAERQRLWELAREQGLEDPAQMPEYAATTAPIRKLARARDKLQQEFENLQLGIAYEKLTDAGVVVQPASKLKEILDYSERQFYPSVMKTPDTENVYTAGSNMMRAAGFRDIARNFYNDVMAGKIPLDKVAKTPVDAYVRKAAETRIAKEKEAKAAEAQYITAAEANMLKTVQAMVPNDKVFGNVGAVEITNALPKQEIARLISDDTAVLDHCVGQGGSAAEGSRNPWKPNQGRRSYEPIYDPATGERNPKASRDSTSYIDDVVRGDQVVSLRDINNGLPVATFQLHHDTGPNGQPQYTIGYASGFKNQAVEPEFVEGAKQFLNSRADDIKRSSGNVIDNLGIYDRKSGDQLHHLRRDANTGMLESEFNSIDLSGLPRFVTVKDLKDYLAGNKPSTAVVTTPPVRHLTTEDAAWVHGELQSAMQNALEYASENFDNITFQRAGEVLNSAYRAHMHEGMLLENIPDALLQMENQLNNNIAQMVNSPSAYAQNAGYALEEFVTDLEGIRGYVDRRLTALRENQAQQNQTSEQHRALQNALQHPDTEHLRATLFAMDGTPNQFWGQMAADERRAGIQQLRQEIARRDAAADAMVADIEHPIIARDGQVFDSLEASRQYDIPVSLAREIAARLTTATEGSLREMLTAAQNRMARTIFDPSYMPPEAQAGTIRMLEEALAELQFFGHADTRGMHFYPPTENLPELHFEVDNTHPANQPVQPRPREVMNDAIARISTEQGMQVAERIETIAVRIAEARYSPNRHPQDFIQALREAADREPSELVERGLYDVADQIETSLVAQNAPPAQLQDVRDIDLFPEQPTPAQNELQNLSDHDLHQRLITNGQPVDWRRLNTRTDEIALLARENNVSIEDMQQAIRASAADLERFSDVEREYMAREVGNLMRLYAREQQAQLPAPVPEQVPTAPNVAPFMQIPERVQNMTFDQIAHEMSPEDVADVEQLSDQIVNNNTLEEIQNIIGLVRSHRMGGWEDFMPVQREYLARLLEGIDELGMPPPEQPQRRGPFQPGGSSAVRGLPLGNLNLRPAITAEMLRGPDTQPVRNFMQQVQNLPGVTQEGLRTGLMAFEQMDPTRQMTKAAFVRELLPSSYDIVDLKGASQENQHLMDAAENAIDADPTYIGQMLGIDDEGDLNAWAKALKKHYNDYDSFPRAVKAILADHGIEDADTYNMEYDFAYRDALETYVAEHGGNLTDEEGYTYSETQRLVETNMGDQYGEFGVAHPDQRGTYHHFDLAPEGTMGHFRGTYNPADPMQLSTFGGSLTLEQIKQLNKSFKKAFNNDSLSDNQKLANLQKLVNKPDFTPADAHYLKKYIDDNMETAFEWTDEEVLDQMRKIADDRLRQANVETKPNSYVIEEIQSDAQKGKTQAAHLHQAHGTLFKAAIQKGLELGADTIYLPTAEVIAKARHSKASKFAPIYDQAIVKEGLKPLLKIPGVTSKMFHGYHEISFTPEAKEHILNGPGQTTPGYAKGGIVRGYANGGIVHETPSIAQMRAALMMRS